LNEALSLGPHLGTAKVAKLRSSNRSFRHFPTLSLGLLILGRLTASRAVRPPLGRPVVGFILDVDLLAAASSRTTSSPFCRSTVRKAPWHPLSLR